MYTPFFTEHNRIFAVPYVRQRKIKESELCAVLNEQIRFFLISESLCASVLTNGITPAAIRGISIKCNMQANSVTDMSANCALNVFSILLKMLF